MTARVLALVAALLAAVSLGLVATLAGEVRGLRDRVEVLESREDARDTPRWIPASSPVTWSGPSCGYVTIAPCLSGTPTGTPTAGWR